MDKILMAALTLWTGLFADTQLGLGQGFGFGHNNTQRGAVTGGAAGAIIGGIVGKQNDRTAQGAVIGGVAGALAGGMLGKAQDEENYRQFEYQQMQQAQQAYQLGRAVSLTDAINMTRSGISPSVIVSQIRAVGVQQEIGVQDRQTGGRGYSSSSSFRSALPMTSCWTFGGIWS